MATTKKMGLFAALALGLMAIPAFGQATPGGGNGGNGGRGNFDPAAARQRMEDRIKTELGVSDDEFKAIQPKIEKVIQARRETGGGFGGGFGGRGRGGRGGPNGGGAAATATPDPNAPPPTPVQEKTKDLQTTLADKDAKPEDIKAKLTALREAKTKAKEDLTKAQEDLRSALTQRQEATLVTMGVLE